MEIELIDEVLESLLFVSGEGLKVSEIIDLLELQKSEINASIARLKSKYGGKCGIHLISYNGKVQFCTNPAYVDVISSVLNPIKERELSNSALETIAIIAYKQPVTRLEIEQIRGVNCEYTLQVLLKHNLIEAVGRKDVVGKPLLFATTEGFLKRFQIDSIDQLPNYNELLESIKILENEKAVIEEVNLYHDFEIPEESTQLDENGQPKKENEELPEEEIPDFLANETDIKKIN